jgi:hypothetical protein
MRIQRTPDIWKPDLTPNIQIRAATLTGNAEYAKVLADMLIESSATIVD